MDKKKDDLATMAREVFKTPMGQKFLNKLDQLYGHRRSYTPDKPHETAFKEGQRDTVIYLIQMAKEVDK